MVNDLKVGDRVWVIDHCRAWEVEIAGVGFAMGTVFDANDNMVLQIRGWGHIQYSEAKNVTPEQIQDSAGELMCDLLNEWFGRDKRSLEKRLIDEGLIEDR